MINMHYMIDLVLQYAFKSILFYLIQVNITEMYPLHSTRLKSAQRINFRLWLFNDLSKFACIHCKTVFDLLDLKMQT